MTLRNVLERKFYLYNDDFLSADCFEGSFSRGLSFL